LLALKGLPETDQPPTVGNIANWMQVQPHSAVELVNRATAHGFVAREHDSVDQRKVLVRLTPVGEAVLRDLSVQHRDELRTAAPALLAALDGVLAPDRDLVRAQ
jgi:DNA-binding MarR family transcriptional regulator